MNAKPRYLLAPAALVAMCAGAALFASHSRGIEAATGEVAAAPAATHIVDLPGVTVRPEAEDLAFYLAAERARAVELPVAASASTARLPTRRKG